jgi:serine/threonine-protein kinase
VRALAAVAVVLAGAAGGPARADDAAAKALFDQGKTLFAEGKFGEACAKLEASFKLASLSSTRGLLGACYEKIGKLASAWAAYRDSAAIADRQGNAERAQAARDKATELEPRLAKLTVEVANTPGLKVTIDGTERPAESFGTELPIDAGVHTVEAIAVDHKPWHGTVDIQDGEKQKLAIPALAEDLTRKHLIEERVREEESIAHRRKLLAYGLFGGGAVSLGVTLTLGLLARSQWHDAQGLGCDDKGVCPTQPGVDAVDGAAGKADIATYVGIAGLALAGAGAFIYFTTPTPHTEAELQLAPAAGAGTVGMTLQGRF